MHDSRPAGYDAANLEAMSEAVAYQAAMQRLVVEKLRLSVGTQSILDFGAGRGDYALAIQAQTARQVVCLEPDATLHGTYVPELRVHADFQDIPVRSLDGAYSLNVLEHIDDDAGAVQELAHRCRPGALVFLLVPANHRLWTPMDTLVGHRRRYRPAELREVAEKAGLEVLESGWFDRTGYFATRAYQFLLRVNMRRQEGAGKITGWQIRAFDRLFSIAEPVLSLSHLPFGKNCWVLARVYR